MLNPWAAYWTNPFETRSDPFAPWSRGVRKFWAAEMHRHQSALAQESARQAWQSWINLWTVLPVSLMGRTSTVRSPY